MSPAEDTVGTFDIETPVFSGPFRLLADLIMEQKVDVCDVPVAVVTDRYLAYAKETESWTLEEATWFLAICAMLLELKVGRLMPRPDVLDEEDLGLSPDLIYARSIELAAFRKMAGEIALRLADNADFHTRDVGPDQDFADLYPDVMEKVTPDTLVELAAAMLRPPAMLDLSHVTPIRVTVAEEIANVEQRLSLAGDTDFRDVVADCSDRIYIVVRFLALLELYRHGRIDLTQAETFGQIQVKWQG
jgi:segregation and condensation protein A